MGRPTRLSRFGYGVHRPLHTHHIAKGQNPLWDISLSEETFQKFQNCTTNGGEKWTHTTHSRLRQAFTQAAKCETNAKGQESALYSWMDFKVLRVNSETMDHVGNYFVVCVLFDVVQICFINVILQQMKQICSLNEQICFLCWRINIHITFLCCFLPFLMIMMCWSSCTPRT